MPRLEHRHHRVNSTMAKSAGGAWRLLDSPVLFAEATGNSHARRDHPAGASQCTARLAVITMSPWPPKNTHRP